MLYFDSENKLICVDSVYDPIIDNYMWILDLDNYDFTLTDITLLLELTVPTLSLVIDGLTCVLPTNWFVVIYDDEIGMMDVVQVCELMGRNFKLFTYGFSDLMVSGSSCIIQKYTPKQTCTMPNLSKKQMLCHPINDEQWICIGPTEAFAKKLKDMYVSELL